MGRLQDIKDQVARDNGYKDWSEMFISYIERDMPMLLETKFDRVTRIFAKAVAEDVLKRAADENKDMALDAYESILSTEINLDL
jgi:hypothetical protein